MKRKIDKFKECVPNTLLLICEDVELHGNRYLLKKNKGKKKYTIPGKLLNYVNDDKIKVIISVNVNDSIYLKKMKLLILILIAAELSMNLVIVIIWKNMGKVWIQKRNKKLCYLIINIIHNF